MRLKQKATSFPHITHFSKKHNSFFNTEIETRSYFLLGILLSHKKKNPYKNIDLPTQTLHDEELPVEKF